VDLTFHWSEAGHWKELTSWCAPSDSREVRRRVRGSPSEGRDEASFQNVGLPFILKESLAAAAAGGRESPPQFLRTQGSTP
jgi:hypothetical protein